MEYFGNFLGLGFMVWGLGFCLGFWDYGLGCRGIKFGITDNIFGCSGFWVCQTLLRFQLYFAGEGTLSFCFLILAASRV